MYGIKTQRIRIGKTGVLVLRSHGAKTPAPGIVWFHGGGYAVGMKEMAYFSRAADLVRELGVTVVAPGYRLSWQAPYPAAFDDCFETLLYVRYRAETLQIRSDQILCGGESAGGGLCAAVCMKARDTGAVNVAFQLPLYPMLSDLDTRSSWDNHGRVWNTRKNHAAWKLYLRKCQAPDQYAAPSRALSYAGLPPAYTFVADGEPFFCEAVQYIEDLRAAGVPAEIDIYRGNMHAFDMMRPRDEISRIARRRFLEHTEAALKKYFSPNP